MPAGTVAVVIAVNAPPVPMVYCEIVLLPAFAT